MYLDDIIIWSDSIEEHEKNVRTILRALKDAKLFVNPKKTKLFCLEVEFLGHKVSAAGIQAGESKAQAVLDWPRPKSGHEVQQFLGLVQYIAIFLPKLAEHTWVLNTLTTKECLKSFPNWTAKHKRAFQGVKDLVVSRECLMVINHDLPGENRIFVTTDASDYCSGAVLSWGTTWETARPVAFDSCMFKGAELNYLVHEKELLAIVRACKKWRSDLLGSSVTVLTDHCTLENFKTQKDLSHRQARWMELLSQFDLTIKYLKGKDTCKAPAFFHSLPSVLFPEPSAVFGKRFQVH